MITHERILEAIRKFRKLYLGPRIVKDKDEKLRPEKIFDFKDEDELKNGIREIIRNVFFLEKISEERVLERLHCFWLVFFDIDGLKSVNFFANHEKGTEMIRRVYERVKTSKKIKSFLELHHLNVIMHSRNGGDEFCILIEARSFLSSAAGTIRMLQNLIGTEINDISIDDLLFFTPEIARSSPNWKIEEDPWAIKTLEELGDFSFIVAASSGAATLYDAFEFFSENNVIEELHRDERVNKLMGDLLDLSEERMNKTKEDARKKLRRSDDPEQKFLAYVLSRNEETRRMLKELIALKKTANELFDRCIQHEAIKTLEEAKTFRDAIEGDI